MGLSYLLYLVTYADPSLKPTKVRVPVDLEHFYVQGWIEYEDNFELIGFFQL